ncbi:MAG: hypothetical protein F6J98_38095 [Moorea sp. SIO4G2]|nr:hypothetical protein [Moorena sp. SIO4G2]
MVKCLGALSNGRGTRPWVAPEYIEVDENGYLVVDDTVLDKNPSHKIELVRKQYSGNTHSVVRGIGVVNCIYVNSKTGKFWVIDYRIYAPEQDGKTKLDHVEDILRNCFIRNSPLKEY